jgi:hypothetical protein
MPLYTRPGIPRHLNKTTAVSTLQEWGLRGSTSSFNIHNVGGDDLEVFFAEKEAENGAGFGLIVPGGMGFEAAIQIDRFWTLAGAAVPFQVLAVIIP